LKQMTIAEIVGIKIPKGKYNLALLHIHDTIIFFEKSTMFPKGENKLRVDSLCAAFSDLYEIAKGALDLEVGIHRQIQEVWYSQGRANMLAEVMLVVDEMAKEGINDQDEDTYPFWASGGHHKLKRRLAKLGENGKKISEGGNDCPPLEEAKANACLICAAPDLYEALKAVEWIVQTDERCIHTQCPECHALIANDHAPDCKLAAALKKADGK
jgi:hypothetical protein